MFLCVLRALGYKRRRGGEEVSNKYYIFFVTDIWVDIWVVVGGSGGWSVGGGNNIRT